MAYIELLTSIWFKDIYGQRPLKRQLKEAIKSFEGTLIMVSHDEGMLKQIANKLIVFDDDKTFTFEDSYEFFLKRKGWKDS